MVYATDTNAVLSAWFASQTNLQTWTADFTQTRVFKTLTQPLVTTGRIAFAVPNRFRWELGRPARTVALREADEMFVVYPLLQRAERYPLGGGAPGEWRDLLALLDAGFPRNRAEFDARFRLVSLTATNGSWLLGLQPVSAFARKLIREVRVGLATNDFALTSNEMVFADGSRLRNDYTNAVLNPPLEAAVFRWVPEPGFKITEPMGR
jgi:outer membrane lipoprotein-sorting protein